MISASASDPLWRAIRRGVAPAFSTDNIRRRPGRAGALPGLACLSGCCLSPDGGCSKLCPGRC